MSARGSKFFPIHSSLFPWLVAAFGGVLESDDGTTFGVLIQI